MQPSFFNDLYSTAAQLHASRIEGIHQSEIQLSEFFKLLSEKIAGPNTKKHIREHGVFNLHVFIGPTPQGTIRGCAVPNTLHCEPEKYMDLAAFNKLIAEISKEMAPYKIEKSTQKGILDGCTFYLVDCKQSCSLNLKGQVTYFDPPHSHKNLNTVNSKALYEAELSYLDNSNVNTQKLLEQFESDWNSFLKSVMAGYLLKGPVLLRIKLNGMSVEKKVNDSIQVHNYIFAKDLNMVEIADLALRLQNFMGGLAPHCYYEGSQMVNSDQKWGGYSKPICIDTITKEKNEVPRATLDFLILPRGQVSLQGDLYQSLRKASAPAWNFGEL